MNEVKALIGGGAADFGMTVSKVCNTNASGKVEEPPAVRELSPRSLGANHDCITSDSP